jgi:hypothetical protein
MSIQFWPLVATSSMFRHHEIRVEKVMMMWREGKSLRAPARSSRNRASRFLNEINRSTVFWNFSFLVDDSDD